MKGETVTVLTRTQTGVDEGNNPTYEQSARNVSDVLVSPSDNADSSDAIRPDGVEIVLTALFPRTYAGSLRGSDVRVRGDLYHVVGDPIAVDGGMRPTRWNRTVNLSRSEG